MEKKKPYEKVDKYDSASIDKLSVNYRAILEEIGENPEREGLLKTP